MTTKPTEAEMAKMYEEMFVASNAYDAELEREHPRQSVADENPRYLLSKNQSTQALRDKRAAWINSHETYFAALREYNA